MKLEKIYHKALDCGFLSLDDSLLLYRESSISDLIYIANHIRESRHSKNNVTWIIDRNINITNVCISNCKFCNFHCNPRSDKAYITTIDEYSEKITELLELGGDQILLQGGMHPKLGLPYYKSLFKELKANFQNLKLHALGPPEIVHLSKMENKTYQYILKELIDAGLDSLPGAGAEILSDRVRKIISPGKCNSKQWLDVMEEAHRMGMVTSATMMFGHIETDEERIKHLLEIRNLQQLNTGNKTGFISFTSWPFQYKNTRLSKMYNINHTVATEQYLRLLATSRIILNNIDNIQASWLTIGMENAKICLHAGANDMGSVMIEENVVSTAGKKNDYSIKSLTDAIVSAGFNPVQRNQKYELIG